MARRKKREAAPPPEEGATMEGTAGAQQAEAQHRGEGPGMELTEPPHEAVRRLTDQLEELQDRHLRTAAEFDNYRKRMARERNEVWARAQAHLVGKVLDALDDLSRVIELDVSEISAQDVISGVDMVERKLVRELEAAGLARVGAAGERFDPNDHEAVGTIPPPSPEEDGTVAEVLQPGYRFAGALLRPARVRVYVAPEPEEAPSEAAGPLD